MPEQYGVASYRHFETGELLEASGRIDDAAYHFGVAGENAVKHALRRAQLELAWTAAGVSLFNTPMKKHFPTLHAFLAAAATFIQANAQGRIATPLLTELGSTAFSARFAGWNIDIRYADTGCTPVANASCATWQSDALHLISHLVI